MNRFQSSTPRVAFGIAAVAMTVITFGLLILVPATIESGGEAGHAQAAAKSVAPAATEVATIAAPIDALDVREIQLASAPADIVRSK